MRKLPSTALLRVNLPFLKIRMSREDKEAFTTVTSYLGMMDNTFAQRVILARAEAVIARYPKDAPAKPVVKATEIGEDHFVYVRLEVEEKALVERAAGLLGKSLAEFGRRALRARVKKVLSKKDVQPAPLSGNVIRRREAKKA